MVSCWFFPGIAVSDMNDHLCHALMVYPVLESAERPQPQKRRKRFESNSEDWTLTGRPPHLPFASCLTQCGVADVDWKTVFDEVPVSSPCPSSSSPPTTAFSEAEPSVASLVAELRLPPRPVVTDLVLTEEGRSFLQRQRQQEQEMQDEVEVAVLSSSRLSQTEDLTLPPKRRVRRINHSPFPKIPRHDLRRKLSLMFANVVNSFDLRLMRAFYEDFCLPSCIYMDCVEDNGGAGEIFRGIKPIKVQGLTNLLSLIEGSAEVTPDVAFRLNHSYINQQLDNPGSRLVMEMTSYVTIAKHGIVAVECKDKKRHLVPVFLVNELIKAGKVKRESMNIDLHPLDAKSFQLRVEGSTIFWLDNNHRIYRIEVQGNVQVCDILD